jgi:DnaD/phage-associated family protein
MDNSTSVENIFITEYMPQAADYCTKVYLYGLYFCKNLAVSENNIDVMAKALGLTAEDVESAFIYWEELGLVQIAKYSPFEVRYLSIRNAPAVKKFKPSKYSYFNAQIQEILDREITLNEFHAYYNLIETCRFEPEAVLQIAKYCTKITDTKVRYNYIIHVAKEWAADGILTVAQVDERLMKYDKVSELGKKILKALKFGRSPNMEDRSYISAWTEKGYDEDALLLIAEACAAKGVKNFNMMDGQIQKLYDKGLVSHESLTQHLSAQSAANSKIKAVFSAAGERRDITARDRDAYNTWTYTWGFGDEVILYAAELSKEKEYPMSYLNKILSSWHAAGLKTLDDIKKERPKSVSAPKPQSTRKYSKEELAALIGDIDKLEF